MAPPDCTSNAQIETHIGSVCRVLGTWELRQFYGKKGNVIREWPVVLLDDGGDVLVESFWDEAAKPDDETIARHQGARVAVTGMLHGEPPGSFQNVPIPCLSPVDSIEALPAPEPG